MGGVFRRVRTSKARTGLKPTDLWLDKALAELESASKAPCTLRFYRADGDGQQPADAALVGVIPYLQRHGHAVVNVSGGGPSPVAYLTVVPKHLAQLQRGQA